jgi:hypothetical protein
MDCIELGDLRAQGHASVAYLRATNGARAGT